VPQRFLRSYALPWEALLVAGIEGLHQGRFVDEALFTG
jgi:hypothetical protein